MLFVKPTAKLGAIACFGVTSFPYSHIVAARISGDNEKTYEINQ